MPLEWRCRLLVKHNLLKITAPLDTLLCKLHHFSDISYPLAKKGNVKLYSPPIFLLESCISLVFTFCPPRFYLLLSYSLCETLPNLKYISKLTHLWGILPNSFYEVNSTLMPKSDKGIKKTRYLLWYSHKNPQKILNQI